MRMRATIVLFGLAVSFPALAEEMTAEKARHFVIGKTFAYSCFEGTRGAGRIHPDGSVVGTIQMGGKGQVRHAVLPANTLRVQGERVCASLQGMPFQPCFNLTKTSEKSFRGAVSGFGFAYCDFTRGREPRRGFVRTATRDRQKPLALRSSLSE